MKILRRGKKSSARFRVVKNNFFLQGTRTVEIGEILEFIGPDNLSTALGLVQRGKIIPDDLPEIGKYIVVSPFDLPGKVEKFKAKTNDIVELKSEDALRLMLSRKVVPKDEGQWSPFRIKEKRKIKDIFEAPQFSTGEPKIDADWKVSK